MALDMTLILFSACSSFAMIMAACALVRARHLVEVGGILAILCLGVECAWSVYDVAASPERGLGDVVLAGVEVFGLAGGCWFLECARSADEASRWKVKP